MYGNQQGNGYGVAPMSSGPDFAPMGGIGAWLGGEAGSWLGDLIGGDTGSDVGGWIGGALGGIFSPLSSGPTLASVAHVPDPTRPSELEMQGF